MPVIVPHVPAPATKWVMRPAVCSHISGPVVFSWASGLAGLAYWLGRKASSSCGQPLGDGVVALRILGRHGDRAHHDLGAVGPQQRDLLRRDLVGHHEHAPVAALGGDDGQADAGVAAGRLDDRAAGPRAARRARRRGSSPAPGGPSTSRPGWWSPSSSPARRGCASTSLMRGEADERRVADQVEHGLGDRRAREPGISHGSDCTEPRSDTPSVTSAR